MITSNKRHEAERREHDIWLQNRGESIDAHVEYMLSHPDNAWGRIRMVDRWQEVIENYNNTADQHNYPEVARSTGQEILKTGSWNGRRVDIDVINRRVNGWSLDWPSFGNERKNVKEAYYRRLFLAQLAVEDFETFLQFQEADIIGLHGTQAVVLPNILASNALLSHSQQHKRQILTGSGEPLPAAFRRGFISFGSTHTHTGFGYADSDLRKRAGLYASYDGYKLRLEEISAFEQQLYEEMNAGNDFLLYADAHRFGIVFGLSRRALWSAGVDEKIGRQVEVDSDIDEICFEHTVGLDYTPVVLVADRHADTVRSVLPESIGIISRDSVERAQKHGLRLIQHT